MELHEHHTGFKNKPRKKRTWVLGSGKATKKYGAGSLNPSGDWTAYIPQDEIQVKNGLETNSCVVFNTNKALATLGNYQKMVLPKNFSERYGAKIGGVTKSTGINPVDFIEKSRTTYGFIEDSELPFNDTIFTFVDFISGVTSDLIEKGRNIIRRFVFGYEHVFNGKEKTVQEKHAKLREALTRGTVCVSVDAWHRDGNGEYYSNGNDEHWTMLARMEGENEIFHDSYIPFEKRARANFENQEALIYFIGFNLSGLCEFDKNLLLQIISLLKQLIAKSKLGSWIGL